VCAANREVWKPHPKNPPSAGFFSHIGDIFVASYVEGKDVIAVPMAYHDEFIRDPIDALLKYGSLPQRAHAPWFTDVDAIDEMLQLPDMITGKGAVRLDAEATSLSLEAAPAEMSLLDGISEHFWAPDDSFWHVHVDLAQHKNRHGDAAGIAMGRIAHAYEEHVKDPVMRDYERVVRSYEVPFAAQVVAPVGDQIYIGSIVRFILQLKTLRHFNITSFSFDGYQSADASQQLMLAGLVTAGMNVEPESGIISGLPKPFSVDGRSVQPYRELLEACNERRCAVPKYSVLREQLRQLELVGPGMAPDHPIRGGKDVADAVAGVVGYLAAFGHAVLVGPGDVPTYTPEEYVDDYKSPESFGIEDDDLPDVFKDVEESVSFAIE
jgi:hypothetical protein